MNKLIIAAIIGLSCVVVSSAQAPAPRPAAPRTPPARPAAVQTPAPAPAHAATELTATAVHDLFARYCVNCHSEKAKAAGMDSARKLTIDTVDFSNVHPQAEKLELIVRKMRAGMMPPANVRRPEPAVYKSMYTWLENELDRTAVAFTPPPGLHRFNRTEYANAIQDLLDLDIDPGKYLPSDDSTHGFDHMAGPRGLLATPVRAEGLSGGTVRPL